MDLAGLSPSTANVRVAVRIRPQSSKERQGGSTECISVIPGLPQIITGPDKSFTYDDVYDSHSTQDEIFSNLAEPTLKFFLAGYNCTILAYGQTGSGKTFTMGTGVDGNMDESTKGIVPRSIEYLLDHLTSSSNSDSWEMFISFLEIYNEDIIDLLAPLTMGSKKSTLSIREDAGGEIFLTGIKEEPVRSPSDVFWAKESISINSGLLALGNVISALGDESKHATHIPYRDSKLTRLLQDSLGGNSRTLMIACVSSATDNYFETVNTLKYANRARNIKNQVQVNHDPNGSAAFEIVQLKKQVSALKQELLQARAMAHIKQGLTTGSPRLTRSESSLRGHDELSRLQQSNKELQRRLDDLQREKINIEAERDALKSQLGPADSDKSSVIRQHLTTISDLRTKLIKYEKVGGRKTVQFQMDCGRASNVPRSPGDIVMESSDLIDRARQSLADKLSIVEKVQSNEDPIDIELQAISVNQFRAAVETRVQTLLKPIRDDLGLKEELTHSLHTLQLEYMAMQQRYNDKIKFLHDTLMSVQKERDSAINLTLPQTDTSSSGSQSMRTLRVKYEDRIKRMGKEVNELKERLEQQSKDSTTKNSASETIVRSLRQTVQMLKMDKARLQSQLSEESSHSRARRSQQDKDSETEMADLRARELQAAKAAKKWHKAYDFQKALLQKRIEQCALARIKIRSLLQVLRRNRIKMDSGCDTPGWRQILQTPTGSVPNSREMYGEQHPIPMDIVDSPCGDIQKRLLSAAPSITGTPRSRLAYGWIPTEMARHLSPERPKPRDFFAQIADAASLSLRVSNTTAAPNIGTSNPFLDGKNKIN